MKTIRTYWPIIAGLLAFALVLAVVFAPGARAQGIVTAGQFTATTPAAADSTATTLMNYLTPVIALVLTGLANRYVPKIPNALVPVIASAIGVATNLLASYATGGHTNVLLGAVAGAAATALHQVWTHAGEPNESPYPSASPSNANVDIKSLPPKSP